MGAVFCSSIPIEVTPGSRATNFYVGRANTNMRGEHYGHVSIDEMEVWDAKRTLLMAQGHIKTEGNLSAPA